MDEIIPSIPRTLSPEELERATNDQFIRRLELQRELLQSGAPLPYRDLVLQIHEFLYPPGYELAEWHSNTLDEVAAMVLRFMTHAK